MRAFTTISVLALLLSLAALTRQTAAPDCSPHSPPMAPMTFRF